MKNKQIVFTKKNTAEILDCDYRKPGLFEVVVETAFSTVSCGTERANITGDPNVYAEGITKPPFPKVLGYSSAGTVIEKGEMVEDICIGDKVAVFWSHHAKYNTVDRNCIVKIKYDNVPLNYAAIGFITSFPLAAIRKTRLEIGESAVVMGLGLLGQLAVRLLKLAGAAPIVAVDPVESRRQEALNGGADYVFSPFEDDFASKVTSVTNGGANVAIEVTGVGAGFDGVLDCMAKFGRVALLGCTRDKNFTIDYYRKIHFPGITVIGAHTMARPDFESHPGFFTHSDDIEAIIKLIALNRLDFYDMIKETHSPEDCPDVYTRLVNDKDFPIIVQFDWRDTK